MIHFAFIKDLLINTSEAGTTGRLYNRFRYLRKIDKGKNPDTQPLPALPPDEHPTHSLDDLLYLKTAVISNSNIVEVRKKLEKTRTLRDELVRAAETDLMEQFPFFFTHPQLVNYKLSQFYIFIFAFSKLFVYVRQLH